MVRWLLANGCDRYVLSANGQLPLDLARAGKHTQSAEALSDIGCTEMENMWGLLAEDTFEDCKAEIERALTGTKSHALDKKLNTYLVWSAARMRLDVVLYLLDMDGMCPRFKVSGSSTLSCLVSCSRKAVIHDPLYEPALKKCLEKGGTANEKNDRGDALLHTASIAANRVAVNFLLDNGAFTNSVNLYATSLSLSSKRILRLSPDLAQLGLLGAVLRHSH